MHTLICIRFCSYSSKKSRSDKANLKVLRSAPDELDSGVVSLGHVAKLVALPYPMMSYDELMRGWDDEL